MARSNSVINVSIIGDARKLISAVDEVDRSTGGLIKSGVKILGASVAIKKGFDIVGDSLDNADRFEDAITRIKGTTNQAFADRIADISDDMANIGLSAPEVAELAASFTDFATAAQVSQPAILAITPQMLDLAAAISATTGKTVDEVITDIGKAAAGNQKSVSDYGIVVNKALNPDERLTDIVQQLIDKFPDAASATSDFAGRQDVLNASWETATTKLGMLVEGPLTDILNVFINILEDIPQLITDFQNFGKAIEDFGRTALGPLGNVRDVLADIVGLFDQTNSNAGTFHVNTTRRVMSADRDIADAVARERQRNGLGR